MSGQCPSSWIPAREERARLLSARRREVGRQESVGSITAKQLAGRSGQKEKRGASHKGRAPDGTPAAPRGANPTLGWLERRPCLSARIRTHVNHAGAYLRRGWPRAHPACSLHFRGTRPRHAPHAQIRAAWLRGAAAWRRRWGTMRILALGPRIRQLPGSAYPSRPRAL